MDRGVVALRGLLLWAAWAVLCTCTGAAPPWAKPDELEQLRAARELWEAGKPAAARARLESYRSERIPDHVAALRAELLRAEGNSTAALIAADQALALYPPSELRARLQRMTAELELERGEVGAAYASARMAWESSRDPKESSEGAFRFAGELERQGFPGEALLLYRTVWEKWPGAARSAEAFARSRALGEQLGADRPEPSSLLETGEQLRSLFRCREAGEFFAAVLERPELDADTRRRAKRGEADCAFQQRRYTEAVTRYRELAAEDPEDLDVAVLAARARGRAGDSKGAVRELEKLARRARAEDKPRVQNLIAIFVSEHDRNREERLLKEIAAQEYAPELVLEARWRLAWLDLEVRRFQSALRWLEPITRGPKSDVEVQRARYWAAVARTRLEPAQGEAELRAIAEELPLTYYGMLAADRLGIERGMERSFLSPRSDTPASAPEIERATLLASSGWDSYARDELRSWLRGGSLDREQRIAAARLLHEIGDHSAAVQLVVDGFGAALDEGVDPIWKDAWQCAWPEPYDQLVRSAVSEFDFDPALVYAIMREESLYRPEVESAAGARGLMQLIPPTARRIARVLAVRDFNPEALYEPATNLRFGTYYLKELLSQFGGSRPLAIAAYNAGPDAVKRWIQQGGALPDDEFVDSVPYGETRRYLRRVLRSYRVYRLLYTDGVSAGGPPRATAQSPAFCRR